MQNLPALVYLCYFLIACGLGAILHDLDFEQSDGYALSLTVVTSGYEPATGIIAPFGPGFERELLDEFCKKHNCDIRWTTADSREEAIALLHNGTADLAIGFSGKQAAVPGVAEGPAYYHSEIVEVRLHALDTDAAQPLSIGPAPRKNHLLEKRAFALWEPFAPLDKDSFQRLADVSVSHHWFWRTYSPSLHSALTAFWKKISQPDNPLLAQLEDRYYGYLPEHIDAYAVTDLMRLLTHRLPQYSTLIARASDGASINPLLFTAVIIQESRLDASTVSPTGVRGIMQLTQATADFLKVNRMDPEEALSGGARYLHMLWKGLEPLGLDAWDRWFFALAAFNQGPRRLEGAMELSRKLGGTGRTWTELRHIYPLLSQKKYADMIGQSICRGQEAVDYVDKVRFFYHILRGLVALDRPEAQHLAPLLRGLDWDILGF